MVVKVLVTNRKARRDYTILESLEVGIALKGTEVKSLRQGRGSLAHSYASVEESEVWLHNFHITPYEYGNIFNPPPERSRKLLLHNREIKRLIGQTALKGYTLVPLRVYLKKGYVKVELAVAKGKKLYDKREVVKKREAEREVARAIKPKSR